MTYAEYKKKYSWMLKQYPGTDYIYGDDMEDDIGTMTRIEYMKAGKRWELVGKYSQRFSRIHYANIVDAVPFFRGLGGRETVTCGYSKLAYLPIEISSISPDKQTKIVRRFYFD